MCKTNLAIYIVHLLALYMYYLLMFKNDATIEPLYLNIKTFLTRVNILVNIIAVTKYSNMINSSYTYIVASGVISLSTH